jgi:hypothetical protein
MTKTDMHATIEKLLEAVFSVRSLPRLHNDDQPPLENSLETAVRRVGTSETVASRQESEHGSIEYGWDSSPGNDWCEHSRQIRPSECCTKLQSV